MVSNSTTNITSPSTLGNSIPGHTTVNADEPPVDSIDIDIKAIRANEIQAEKDLLPLLNETARAHLLRKKVAKDWINFSYTSILPN
jgi:hypothetical protein